MAQAFDSRYYSELEAILFDREKKLFGNLSRNEIQSNLYQNELARKIAVEKAIPKKNHNVLLHGDSIVSSVRYVGEQLKIEEPLLKLIEYSALMHDVGKIKIDSALLESDKVFSRTSKEFGELMKHAEYGAMIINPYPFENCFSYVAEQVKHHHENINGTGYPSGLRGNEIPVGSRIIRVSDSYNAMTHPRPYNHVMEKLQAIEEIISNSGVLFDEKIAQIFCEYILREKN